MEGKRRFNQASSVMTIQTLLNTTVEPLDADDTPQHAMNVLLHSRLAHLPVVDDAKHLLGLVTEQQVMEALGTAKTLRDCLSAAPVSVDPDAHYFNAARHMVGHDLDLLPVTDPDGRYLGVVTRGDLFAMFSRMLGTDKRGAILVLEMAPRDYSMAQLLHIIEQNDVKVLAVGTEQPDHPEDNLRLTLKLNITDATRTRHVLDHHGYKVLASFNEAESREDLQDRAREFMRYLEV